MTDGTVIPRKLRRQKGDYVMNWQHWLSGEARSFFYGNEETHDLMKDIEYGKPYHIPLQSDVAEEDVVLMTFCETKGGRFVIAEPTYVRTTSKGGKVHYTREGLPDGFTIEGEPMDPGFVELEPGEGYDRCLQPCSYEVD